MTRARITVSRDGTIKILGKVSRWTWKKATANGFPAVLLFEEGEEVDYFYTPYAMRAALEERIRRP